MRVRVSDDGQYRLITVLPPLPRLDPWDSLSYFLWLPLLIAVLCYLLAVHLASPLRGLRRVVETVWPRRSEHSLHLTRQDEIGELARAFNRMADQITTLLSAERRLAPGRLARAALAAGPAGLRRRAGAGPAPTARRHWRGSARKPTGSSTWLTSCSSSPGPRGIRRPETSSPSGSTHCCVNWSPIVL